MYASSTVRTRGARWCAGALFVVLAGVAGPSCNKVPLLAPSGSIISLFASNSIVPANGSVDIIATVIESSGTPVQNGTTVSFFSTLGTMTPAQAQTQNGQATVKLVVGTQSGEARVRAASGSFQTKDADALVIKVGSAAAGRVDLSANSQSLPSSGGTVQLLAVVFDITGNRLPGVIVSFSSTFGTLGQSSVTSDTNGEARTTLTTTTNAKVTATVSGATPAPAPATLDISLRVAPVVSIGNISPNPATAALPVTIPVTITVAAGGAQVVSATIDFGDGGAPQTLSTAGTTNAVHTYQSAGTFTATATAVDAAGEIVRASAPVIVKPLAPIPVTLSVSANPSANMPTTFTANAVLPSGAFVDHYDWNFDVTRIDPSRDPTRVTNSPSTTYIYNVAGNYSVSVRVTTTDGAEGSTVIDLRVLATLFTVSLSASPPSPSIGSLVTFTATPSLGFSPTEYWWTIEGTTFGPTTRTYSTTFATSGTKVVTVRAVLADQNSASATIQVIVQ
jgi:hypothetical protein